MILKFAKSPDAMNKTCTQSIKHYITYSSTIPL
jgi:hypothetical protein